MTHEEYSKRCLELQYEYDIIKLPKVCDARVNYLVDLVNVKTDYIYALEEKIRQLEEKRI